MRNTTPIAAGAGTAGPLPQPTRAEGPLTDAEVTDLRTAYLEGARGQLLIGLRQRERLATLLLPPRRTLEDAARLLQQNAEQLRRIGADGFIHVRRARLKRSRQRTHPCLLLHERVAGIETLRAISLSASRKAPDPVPCPVTYALAHALASQIGLASRAQC